MDSQDDISALVNAPGVSSLRLHSHVTVPGGAFTAENRLHRLIAGFFVILNLLKMGGVTYFVNIIIPVYVAVLIL